ISFSLGLWLSLSAGILGLPLLLLLVPWFAKYLFVILSFAALGRPDVPVLSEELINPAQVRPLFILFLILVFGAAYWSATKLSEGAENAVILSAIFLLPAMISVVVISNNPFRSLNPVNLARLIWSLRLDYGGVAIALRFAAGHATRVYGIAFADADCHFRLALLAAHRIPFPRSRSLSEQGGAGLAGDKCTRDRRSPGGASGYNGAQSVPG
ncbi:MAG: hypothetical protein IIA98_01845, partial [Proteobacteria bacterium]|nr:hypothetical protein [Pseudomonadota bacterium]